MKKNINVILVQPHKKPVEVTIENKLDAYQKLVGGYIECVYPFDDHVILVCNEEGKINGLELNRALRDEDGNIYDIIAGDFFICSDDAEGNFTSVSKKLIDKYKKIFEIPNIFYRQGNKIIVLDENID